MLLIKLLSAAALPASILAASHDIDVAENGLSYSPNNVQAAAGDTLNFHFISAPHSVAQSTFDKPCQPSSGGIWSGVVSDSGSNAKVFQVNVTSTDPLWFYCAVASHCSMGMSMVVNQPSSGDTLTAYQSAAKSVTPSEPSTVEGGQFVAAASVPSGSASAPASSSTASSTASSNSGGGGAYGAPAPASSGSSSTGGATEGRGVVSLGAVVAGLIGAGWGMGWMLS